MDHELWANVVASVERALRAIPRFGRRPFYADRLILLMQFWIVWHDRCLSWACDRTHYGTLFRPRHLPSISRFSRRVKSDRIQLLLQWVHDDLAVRGTACPFDLLSYVDGKALLVSPVSKDPDARSGKTSGTFAKGYKLHAMINEQRRVIVWCLTPLNTDEKVIATELINHVPLSFSQTDAPQDIALHAPLTLGDKNYDSANLHRAYAQHGRHLLTPLRGTKLVGPNGRSKDTLNGMGPRRREVIGVWDQWPELVKFVMKSRNNAEGTFSVLSLACGLNGLPGFVRRLPRVRRWVGCKLILYHARMLAQEAEKRVAA
jgi:Transposase DDE domain